MPARSDRTSPGSACWYRQPVLWLGMAVLAASLAGCIWLIALSMRHADTPLNTSHKVFGVPVSTHSSRSPQR
ncbi:MAG: hypothetical protein EPN74_08790 [Rhodanobacter sp.]|nr:MAG: hypothetical protein EPN74_08790 [Rhodanobacter sp.]